MPSTLEVCREDLFTKLPELQQKYPPMIVEKVMRIREMYNWFIAYPNGTDREFVTEECIRHNIHRTTAYADLAVVKSLMPMLATASRDFHRWRTNEMLMAAYKKAEGLGDAKNMERVAGTYGKLNRIDLEDEQKIPLDKIMWQPFTATNDPRVLGIEPIPNIDAKIKAMIDKYSAETMDIDDVEYEEVDLEFDTLFPDKPTTPDNGTETDIL